MEITMKVMNTRDSMFRRGWGTDRRMNYIVILAQFGGLKFYAAE